LAAGSGSQELKVKPRTVQIVIDKDVLRAADQAARRTKRKRSSRDLFSFRAGSSLLIPYYKVSLARDGSEFRVHEVVVGPTPDVERSRRSVSSFLRYHGLEKVPVEVSGVPYRNW
jgi:hypothetical protein